MIRPVWMEGYIDRHASIEGHGGEVLVEEWLKHDHFVPLLEESDKD